MRIDLEDPAARAVLVGMLREILTSSTKSDAPMFPSWDSLSSREGVDDEHDEEDRDEEDRRPQQDATHDRREERQRCPLWPSLLHDPLPSPCRSAWCRISILASGETPVERLLLWPPCATQAARNHPLCRPLSA